ncbi:uncharacterized protein F5891DRAFT_978759 [Suillus fuscotomentosus]|uniref:CxC2-like cysteine cluster KDZ transposase-associated domain-containing protein n=1 Tax=Suillus fuscotomentosus TaxID=1912939 RepID=A0AAD4HLV3_9AGAM|nr:uncharacterized protein F5891DRAFT_978759 [Suillus fuscotomentosus]KAG1902460.1 hypothetical protein F5891DRAFT_978759 [Suillus fuscotomentosus]
MARPLICKTTEAKIVAAREKRARYYANHRDSILKRRQELHSSKSKQARAEAKQSKELSKAIAKALRSSDTDSESDNESDNSSDEDENKLNDLPECLLVIKNIKDNMLKTIGDDPCVFAQGILQAYVQSMMVDDCSTKGDISIIESAMVKVQKSLDDTIAAQDQILNFCGISPEWHAADSLSLVSSSRHQENDTPRENRDEHQYKHASFEQSLSGRLSVSTAYYMVSDPSKQPQEAGTVDDTLIEEFDFSDIQADHYFSDNSEEPITWKWTAADDPLRVWYSDAKLFLEEFIRLEGHGSHTQDSCFCGSNEPSLYRCKDCHGIELVCRHNPTPPLNDDFVIVDVNGVHAIALDFCGCQTAQLHVTQLLQVRLFPATTIKPKTATTFRVLEYFQILSFKSKVSALEFYQTVARLTDNTEWHFLKQIKRSGQGHQPGTIAAMEPGACAVICPACPHPGKNLPDGWENAPPESRFLYALFLAIDANFRLARWNFSSDAVDPGLNHGYAFFVEETAYKSFLNSRRGISQERPNSVGDLQKGERYINMDYMFFSSMQSASMLQVINISYNIACQWSKNLRTCMSAFPQQHHLAHNTKTITFLVPKFHLPAHILSCQTTYSFNFIKGVGRTNGKAPECGWADINPIATSTREMGPGSRCDTLNDHFNDWNWKKVCLMGKTLACKLKAALPEVLERRRDLNDFEAALDSSQLACWKEDVVAWEAERSKPNPFELKVTRLDLEDQQRCLAFEAGKIGQHATNAQQVTLIQCINSLHQRIDTWSCVQLLYMPLSHLYKYKDTFIRGQCANTHATGIINNVDNRIDALTAKYNAARNVLVNLAPRLHKDDNWLLTFKPLDRAKDAVLLRQDNGTTVGQQTVSWIWKTRGVSDNMEFGLQDWPELEHIDGKKRCSYCMKK